MNELTFTVTVDEGNLILTALQELPAKVSMGLILKLDMEGKKQIEAQQKAALKLKK